jgi:hypothetical protein
VDLGVVGEEYLVERDGQWQHVERGIPHRCERICPVS